MIINQEIAVISGEILLVPYSAHHVPQYHRWMSSSQLRMLTASEELTLEEELDNQKSWREDSDKLTFISVDASSWNQRNRQLGAAREEQNCKQDVIATIDDEDATMRGDVNMFFQEDEANASHILGEVNIMVANPSARGKGFGKRVLLIFLWYVLSQRSLLTAEYCAAGKSTEHTLVAFVAKIDQENRVSISMFEAVGFQRISDTPNYFGEVELKFDVDMAREKIKQTFLNKEPMLLRYDVQSKT